MKNILSFIAVLLLINTSIMAESNKYDNANALLKKAGKSSSQEEVTNSIKKATDIFTNLCKGGDENSCKSLGQIGLIKITSFAKDSEKILQTACESKNPDAKSCAVLADAYFHGIKKANIIKDTVRGLKALTRACENNNQSACFALGNRYLKGDGVNKNIKLGQNNLYKSCDTGYVDSCMALSFMHMYGTYGAKKDYIRAEKSLTSICNANNEKGCIGLGEYFSIIKKDNNSAEKYFKKSCDLGSGQGCHRLAKLVSLSEKDNGKPKTITLIRKSCKLGYVKACTILADSGIKR